MIGYVGEAAQATHNTAGTTSRTLTPTRTIPVGRFLILRLGKDNNGTTNANTGVTEISSVTDTAGNTWTRTVEGRRSPTGAALDGSVGAIWECQVTTQLTTSSTITVNFSSATAGAYVVEEFIHESTSGGIVAAGTAVGQHATTATPSLAITGLSTASAKLILFNVSAEGPTADTLTTGDLDYQRLSRVGVGSGVSAQRTDAWAGVFPASTTSDTGNVTLGTSRDTHHGTAAWREANPPANWWQSGMIAADRLDGCNGVLRFRRHTQGGGWLYTAPDLSLIIRTLTNGGSASTAYSHTVVFVTPSTKANRYRGRFKIGTSAEFSNGNFIGLTFRYTTDGDRWEVQVWNDSGTLRVRYNKRVSLVHNFTNLGTLPSFSETWDIEVRDDGTNITFWRKTSAEGEGDWVQVGGTVSDSTYGTSAGVGWVLGSSVSGWNATNSGIIRWEAYTAASTFTGSGTLTATAQTLTGTGTITFEGSGSLSAVLQTLVGSGLLVFQSSGSLSPPLQTLVGTGSVTAYVGAGSLSPPSHTLSGTGDYTNVYTGSGTLSAALQTLSGNGLQIFSGAGTVTALAQTLTGTGQIVFTGDGVLAVPAQTLSGNAVFTDSLTGSGTLTATAQTLSGNALLVYSGSGSISPPAQTLVGAGTITNVYVGSGSISPPSQTLAGSALLVYGGSGAITAPGQTLVGAGLYNDGLSGFGTLTAPAHILTGAGVYAELFSGSGSLTTPAQTLSGSGLLVYSGSGAISPPPMTLTGGGQLVFAGSGTLSAASHTLTGVGVFNRNIGSGALTATAQTLTGTGTLRYQGSGTLAPPAQTLSGTGAVPIAGAGTLTNRNQTLTGTGNLSNIYLGSGNLISAAHTLTGIGQLGNFGGYFPNPGTGTWLGYFQAASGSWSSAFTSTITDDWEDYFD